MTYTKHIIKTYGPFLIAMSLLATALELMTIWTLISIGVAVGLAVPVGIYGIMIPFGILMSKTIMKAENN